MTPADTVSESLLLPKSLVPGVRPNMGERHPIATCLIFVLVAIYAVSAVAQQRIGPDFLPVDEAFPTQVRLNDDGSVVASWLLPDGYYLYKHSLKIVGKEGTELGELVIPEGLEKEDEYFGLTEVFYNFLEISSPVTGQTGDIVVEVHYQGCADLGLCYPPEAREFRINVGDSTGLQSSSTSIYSEVSLFVAVGSALLAGMILNLMPCVFPILSIKAVSLLQSQEETRRMFHAFGYLIGVVGTFLLLALVLLLLRALGESIGWGFQLQSPGFVAAMALIFFIMSLNMLGLVEIPGFGLAMSKPNPVFTGVLAVIVATPCTVPFMAAATGYAISKGGLELVLVMAFLGIGMAAPYLLVTLTPQVAKWLPKPGAWMATLKQVMAFPLLLSLVWLIWVLARQVGPAAIAWALCGMVVLTALALIGRSHLKRLRFAWGAMLVVIAGTIYAVSIPFAPQSNGELTSFDLDTFNERVINERPLFLNVTADWCITCIVNERTTLSRERVQGKLAELGVQYVTVDWTNRDAQITGLLQQFGRVGVPLYVLFTSTGEPILLPQVLTPELVIDTLEEHL